MIHTTILQKSPPFAMLSYKEDVNHDTRLTLKRRAKDMQHEKSDWELIRQYLDKADGRAFEQLMSRHYDSVYKRLLWHCKHPHDAEDMAQQLWIRVVNNLPNYRDDGKFASFLMRSTTNMLTDYWRRKGVKDQVIQDVIDEEHDDVIDLAADRSIGTSALHEVQDQVTYLTQKLIPELSCDQRLAFLLVHESEYWEEKNRLGWQHLAELNGMDAREAWIRFERVRNAFLQQLGGKPVDAPDCDSLLIFVVWTQTQRLDKRQTFTWEYFSEVLGVSINTLKTRYRTALKKLAQGLKDEY